MIEKLEPTLEQSSDIGLTRREEKILESLTPENIETLRRLRSDNLTLHKREIVGVRSEDIMYFLQCIQKGYIPVEPVEVMSYKATEKPYFYVTPNPDSTAIHERPELLKALKGVHSFEDTIRHNSSLYGTIGVRAAIFHNIFPLVKDPKGLLRSWSKIQPFRPSQEVENETTRMIWLETYLKYVVDEILEAQRNKSKLRFHQPSRLPKLSLLGDHIPPKYADAVLASLTQFTSRGGMSLAFNRSLLKYAGSGDRRDDKGVHTIDEVTFEIPSKKLELDAVLGFEPLGEFEDKVLERLGIE